MFDVFVGYLFAIELYVLIHWSTLGKVLVASYDDTLRKSLTGKDLLTSFSQLLLWHVPMAIFTLIATFAGTGHQSTLGIVLFITFLVPPVMINKFKFNSVMSTVFIQATRIIAYSWYILKTEELI